MLGVFAATGALAGGAVALASAWLLFPDHRRVPRAALVLLGAGALVTGAFQLNLAAWAIERFGYGIRSESLPLAAAMALAATFCVAVSGLVVRRAASGHAGVPR